MQNIFRWLAFFVLLTLASCVPNKRFVYLQKDDLSKDDFPRDSIVRHYAIDTFQYKIQPNDILSIRFESLTPKDFDFLNSGQGAQNLQMVGVQVNPLLIGELVDEKGFIFYPVVGKVKVAGLTIFKLQEKLQSIASLYLESPVVKVRLINYRITILGEVNREGSITLNNNRVTLLEAIGLMGGFTDLANKEKVKLIRQKATGTEVIYLNLLDERFLSSPYFYVYQNDVLIVPSLPVRPYLRYSTLNLTLLVSALTLLVLTVNLTK